MKMETETYRRCISLPQTLSYINTSSRTVAQSREIVRSLQIGVETGRLTRIVSGLSICSNGSIEGIQIDV